MKYTKKQITEAIAYWKKQLVESEDVYSLEQDLPVASAKELIWKISPTDPAVKTVEFNTRTNSFNGIEVSSDDIEKVNAMCKDNSDTYRPFAYYTSAASGSPYDNETLKKFSDACDVICRHDDCSEDSYNEFINKEFESYDPSEWDEKYFDEFKTAFPSFADFVKALSESAMKRLIDGLHNSDSLLHYVDIEQVKTTSAGDAYVIIMWRS